MEGPIIAAKVDEVRDKLREIVLPRPSQHNELPWLLVVRRRRLVGSMKKNVKLLC
jgi:hypothetical protein